MCLRRTGTPQAYVNTVFSRRVVYRRLQPPCDVPAAFSRRMIYLRPSAAVGLSQEKACSKLAIAAAKARHYDLPAFPGPYINKFFCKKPLQ